MATRARAESARFGVLLVDKPPGPTSHDLVGWARWALRERSIGHCGTLDPAATGLMVLCVGAATKLVEHLTTVDKGYRARFVLGASTTTADAAGELVAEAEVSAEVEARVAELAAGLLGPLELPPPAYSAIKVDGRRAHELARAGTLDSLPSRPMAVRALELLGQGRAGPRAWVDVELRVAKGTYVRSLAEELGRRLGVPAHLGSLRRTACGALSVDDPRVVTGLGARELEPRPGHQGRPRPPIWRIEARASEAGDLDPRERARALLEAKLQPPWTLLPYGVSVLASEAQAGDHRPALERLAHGQRLALGDPIVAGLGLGPGSGPWALVDRAAGQMIIVERELDAGRLAPRKVLRFDPGTLAGH